MKKKTKDFWFTVLRWKRDVLANVLALELRDLVVADLDDLDLVHFRVEVVQTGLEHIVQHAALAFTRQLEYATTLADHMPLPDSNEHLPCQIA